MKYLISLLPLWVYAYAGPAQTPNSIVSSPDGKLQVTLSLDNGKPAYSVSLNGNPFIVKSPLGLKTNVDDFTEGLSVGKALAISKLDNTYELPNIKQSKVHYVANEGVISYSKENRPAIDITFRVSNNDVAFRYKVYPQKASRSCVINEEKTGFTFPTGTTTFLSAQSKAMVGFARTMDFMKTVPTTWDEVRYIDGYPGRYVVLARRQGTKWYVAGVNAQKESLKLKIKLPMITPGAQYKLYSDDAQLTGRVTTAKLPKNQEMEWVIPTNGAALLVN
ncbi:glycoside hydrolase family 97 N-terminal domain-containing protein [Spirosoma sordidisoli]|uniref:Glycoside hydrolase family 97 protein n=1 Tax=Spirosoma sordidisoli TaxID=2502893 RepID=A0A4Q2UG00_9BACT|nr:glycoside hydrolase family 97 N-terminal domain-containing protein [Spirosoma sordidisoli]RYC68034.1 hypothetical protein EQG79_21505 [Spirosoma sordidisoli]